MVSKVFVTLWFRRLNHCFKMFCTNHSCKTIKASVMKKVLPVSKLISVINLFIVVCLKLSVIFLYDFDTREINVPYFGDVNISVNGYNTLNITFVLKVFHLKNSVHFFFILYCLFYLLSSIFVL